MISINYMMHYISPQIIYCILQQKHFVKKQDIVTSLVARTHSIHKSCRRWEFQWADFIDLFKNMLIGVC